MLSSIQHKINQDEVIHIVALVAHVIKRPAKIALLIVIQKIELNLMLASTFAYKREDAEDLTAIKKELFSLL